VVLDDDRDGVRADRDVQVDWPPVAVLDGVDDQVAQDALDAALVDLRLGRFVGGVDLDDAAPALGEGPSRLDDLGDRADRGERALVPGTSSTRSSPATSTGRVTSQVGKTTVSSRGTRSNEVM